MLQFAFWKGQVWTQSGETSLFWHQTALPDCRCKTDDSPRASLWRITARGHVTSLGQLPRFFCDNEGDDRQRLILLWTRHCGRPRQLDHFHKRQHPRPPLRRPTQRTRPTDHPTEQDHPHLTHDLPALIG